MTFTENLVWINFNFKETKLGQMLSRYFLSNITILVNYKDVKVNVECRIEIKAIISISDAR